MAIKALVQSLIDRFLGEPIQDYVINEELRVSTDIKAGSGGLLLRGTLVRFTGVYDSSGRLQVEIIDMPDYQWGENRSLPYGPGFVLFVDRDCLHKRID